MKLLGALSSILFSTLLYAFGASLFCFVHGFLVGASLGFLFGLPFSFVRGDIALHAAAGGAYAGALAGCSGGGAAFVIAGLIQGCAAFFDYKNPLGVGMRFDVCLQAAFWTSALCACGGMLTGAMIGGTLVYFLAPPQPWVDTVLYGAALGGAAAYALGLFIGALAPGVIAKAKERIAEWRATRTL